jgi:hypothetical protein
MRYLQLRPRRPCARLDDNRPRCAVQHRLPWRCLLGHNVVSALSCVGCLKTSACASRSCNPPTCGSVGFACASPLVLRSNATSVQCPATGCSSATCCAATAAKQRLQVAPQRCGVFACADHDRAGLSRAVSLSSPATPSPTAMSSLASTLPPTRNPFPTSRARSSLFRWPSMARLRVPAPPLSRLRTTAPRFFLPLLTRQTHRPSSSSSRWILPAFVAASPERPTATTSPTALRSPSIACRCCGRAWCRRR